MCLQEEVVSGTGIVVAVTLGEGRHVPEWVEAHRDAYLRKQLV